MTTFTITSMLDASIMYLNSIKDTIVVNPDYQRRGGVWSLYKRQLLIDSLINGYDIPKFYLHDLKSLDPKTRQDYAIIDGRQRLEAIWDFMSGKFPLGKDFAFIRDPEVRAAGMTFAEFSKEYPQHAVRFNSRVLSIMLVQTDDIDFIEDMFSRLNEAVPLNAAEKRNAFPGPLPPIIREVATHKFFAENLAVRNTRYRHQDISAKLLYLENSGEIIDTKKVSLDHFVLENKSKTPLEFAGLKSRTTKVLDTMSGTFAADDELLKSAGMVTVYYVLFSRALKKRWVRRISRGKLSDFERLRSENRTKFENEAEGIDFRLIEFDELMQSSNDGAAIRERYETLAQYLGASEL